MAVLLSLRGIILIIYWTGCLIFSQIPDGYGSGRGYGRGMGGRMMAGRGFGNSFHPFYCYFFCKIYVELSSTKLHEGSAMGTYATWIPINIII